MFLVGCMKMDGFGVGFYYCNSDGIETFFC